MLGKFSAGMPRPLSVTSMTAFESRRESLTSTLPCLSIACKAFQQKIEQHLVDLITVVLDVAQRRIFVQAYLDSFGERLLTSEHDRVFDGDVEIAFADPRCVRPRGLQ